MHGGRGVAGCDNSDEENTALTQPSNALISVMRHPYIPDLAGFDPAFQALPKTMSR